MHISHFAVHALYGYATNASCVKDIGGTQCSRAPLLHLLQVTTGYADSFIQFTHAPYATVFRMWRFFWAVFPPTPIKGTPLPGNAWLFSYCGNADC